MYLFGFGSLINLNSAQKSFQRKLSYEDLIPVKVMGYKKVWNAIEKISFNDKEANGVFLNLKKELNSYTHGVIIEITKEEFEVLKQREKNYSQVTIKAQDIKGVKLNGDIVAFMTTNKDKLAKKGDKNTFIPSKYIDILTDAFKYYDESFILEYKKETLKKLPFELKDGVYKFCDPMQNKLTKEGIEK